MAFWQYIEPNAVNLTYYSSARDVSGFASNVPFPCFNATGKKFPGKGVGAQRTLQPIDEFWLFLTRVRLGLFERDLAFRLNISISTVSDIVNTWSNYLFVILGSLPIWSSKDVIKQHLPKVFEGRFENVRCIIDCTEIKCEKPRDLQKQSELYSEYKSHNTFKGLGGISPNVWTTFVSGLYGGSISDREVVEKSHFTVSVGTNTERTEKSSLKAQSSLGKFLKLGEGSASINPLFPAFLLHLAASAFVYDLSLSGW